MESRRNSFRGVRASLSSRRGHGPLYVYINQRSTTFGPLRRLIMVFEVKLVGTVVVSGGNRGMYV